MLEEQNINEHNEDFIKLIDAKNRAFIKICRLFLFVMVLFNASAMFLIIYCHLSQMQSNTCQELTNNISWIVKSADNTLSIFICCITIFYMFDKNELKSRIIDILQTKFLNKKNNE